MYGFFSISLSNTLARDDNRRTGLWEESRSIDLSGLRIGTMFENFHRSIKYESRKSALNRWIKNRMVFFGRFTATSAVNLKEKCQTVLFTLLHPWRYFCKVYRFVFAPRLPKFIPLIINTSIFLATWNIAHRIPPGDRSRCLPLPQGCA